MKQPRSSSHTTSALSKRALLPSFRQSKLSSKVQELTSTNKGEFVFHINLIPLQIVAMRKNGEQFKVIINPNNEIILQEETKMVKKSFNSNPDIEWVELNLGEVCQNVKIKKIADENIFIGNNCVLWDKPTSICKNKIIYINLKQETKPKQIKTEKSEVSNQSVLHNKQDKTKQMRSFIANLMSRKLTKRTSETFSIQPKIGIKKKSDIIKSKLVGCYEQSPHSIGLTIKFNQGSSNNSTSVISTLGGPKSFKRDIFQKQVLKDSKFTGKSEKQTSIGDQSIYGNQKQHINNTELSCVETQNYEKMKNKFDSQPYFYQKSTINSNGQKNSISNIKRFSSRCQEVPIITQRVESKNQTEQYQANNNKISNVDCLLNKSEDKSVEQVEEDIKRSGLINSSINKSGLNRVLGNENEKGQNSSSCYESKEIESSGTIYESKYQ